MKDFFLNFLSNEVKYYVETIFGTEYNVLKHYYCIVNTEFMTKDEPRHTFLIKN